MRPILFAALFAFLPNIAAAQSTTNSATTGLIQIVAALGVVIALMLAMAWFMKRFGNLSPLQRVPMKVISAISVGHRERVVVVEIADQWLVLGVTPQQITSLSTLPKQDISTSNANNGASPTTNSKFTDWLKASIEKRKHPASQDELL